MSVRFPLFINATPKNTAAEFFFTVSRPVANSRARSCPNNNQTRRHPLKPSSITPACPVLSAVKVGTLPGTRHPVRPKHVGFARAPQSKSAKNLPIPLLACHIPRNSKAGSTNFDLSEGLRKPGRGRRGTHKNSYPNRFAEKSNSAPSRRAARSHAPSCGAIPLQASIRVLTELTDFMNISRSAPLRSISTTRSAPPAPITVGTPQ